MNGAAQVLELDQQTGKIMVRGLPVLSFLQLNRDGTRQRHATAPVVALSFSPDGSQLAATVRDGTAASTYMSPRPFTQLTGPYIDRSLGVREDDDQGVSSAICCAERNLLCVTYWTRSGIPLLIDYASRKSRQLDNRTIKLDIGTRIQQAVFSRSGHALILINNKGSIFKITIDDIDHIRAEEIGGSRVLSRVIGKSQILDMKIAADERSLKVVWVKNSSRAVVNSYPL
ncbi:MAG: hypothetical protein M1840_006953 [Geoglossum simile]|nr:MAG: hypothetical protein M1840_006953 [Geoglossum simile]